jgi:carbon storage regulator
MLVLTRKINQALVIAGNIQVHVLAIERDRVKIGISAPPDVIVLREELVTRAVNPVNDSAPERQGPAAS